MVFSTDSPCREDLIKYKRKWGFFITDYLKKKNKYWKLNGSNVKIPDYSSTFGDLMDYISNNRFSIVGFKEARLPKKAKNLLSKEKYHKFKNLPTFVAFKCQK